MGGVPSAIFKEHTFEHYRKSIVDNHVGHYDVAETLFKALIHPWWTTRKWWSKRCRRPSSLLTILSHLLGIQHTHTAGQNNIWVDLLSEKGRLRLGHLVYRKSLACPDWLSRYKSLILNKLLICTFSIAILGLNSKKCLSETLQVVYDYCTLPRLFNFACALVVREDHSITTRIVIWGIYFVNCHCQTQRSPVHSLKDWGSDRFSRVPRGEWGTLRNSGKITSSTWVLNFDCASVVPKGRSITTSLLCQTRRSLKARDSERFSHVLRWIRKSSELWKYSSTCLLFPVLPGTSIQWPSVRRTRTRSLLHIKLI